MNARIDDGIDGIAETQQQGVLAERFDRVGHASAEQRFAQQSDPLDQQFRRVRARRDPAPDR